MKKKIQTNDGTSQYKMSDGELSKKLGYYQCRERISLLVGGVGIVSGILSFFAVQDKALKSILMAVLLFGGICCVLFLAGDAQKKKKKLLKEQLGDFFESELETAFGPACHTEKLSIDRLLLEKLNPLDDRWEKCKTENFREGFYHSIHFSVSNLELYHVYEKGGHGQGSLGQDSDRVFKGIVLRCQTRSQAPCEICVNRKKMDGSWRDLTPQFIRWLDLFEQDTEGTLASFGWEKDVFSLVLETDHGFASVDGCADLRDLDEVRRSYENSLRETEKILGLLLQNEDLFQSQF